MKKKKVHFICSDNSTLSPIAEEYFKKHLEKLAIYDVETSSSGYDVRPENRMPKDAVLCAAQNGIDFSYYTAKPSNFKKIKTLDLVIGFNSENISVLKENGISKIAKMGDFGGKGTELAVPRGKNDMTFRELDSKINDWTFQLAKAIKRQGDYLK